MNRINSITIAIIIFFTLISIFTFLYNKYGNYSEYDSLYISTSFQTFTGTSIIDTNKTAKNISIVQMILSYILMVIILHFLINL